MKCYCEDLVAQNSSVSSVCLKDLCIFDSVDEKDFERFRGIGVRKTFRDGETLFVQGGPVDGIFVIKAGRIRLSKVLEDGTEITLDFRKPGDLIGEEAFSHRVNYPLTAWAMEETVTCGFRVSDFNQLILDNPDLGLKLIGNMSKRILSLNSRLGSATAGNLEDRLFHVLSNIASEHGRENLKGLLYWVFVDPRGTELFGWRSSCQRNEGVEKTSEYRKGHQRGQPVHCARKRDWRIKEVSSFFRARGGSCMWWESYSDILSIRNFDSHCSPGYSFIPSRHVSYVKAPWEERCRQAPWAHAGFFVSNEQNL